MLICRTCGAIVEFEEPRLEELQVEVAQRHGFELRGHRHELYGVCSACLAASGGPQRT
jgi:Fur family transcriptional regulator, ferric uptake regulator